MNPNYTLEQRRIIESMIRRWLENPEELDELLRRLQSDDIVDWPMEGGEDGKHE